MTKFSMCGALSPNGHYCNLPMRHNGNHKSTFAGIVLLDEWSEHPEKYNRYWQGYNDGYKLGYDKSKTEMGDATVEVDYGWICPRCRQVNAPFITHCLCKDED